MAKIPVYESITVGRQTPNLYDPNAVAQAGSGMRAVAGVSEELKIFADKQAEAQAVTETNLAVIESKKKKIELQQQMQQENMANPKGFTKAFEEQLKKVDEEFASGLSSRAKSAYLETARNNNLSFYDNNLTWENNRQTSMHAERIEAAAETLGTMAFRAGTEGRGIDDLKKDADATLVAASTFVAPEKLSDIKRKIYGNITETWISGVAEKNPSKAKRLLETRKYDDDLGSEGLLKTYSYITRQIEKIENEVEAANTKRKNGVTDALELAVIRGEADENMYKTALGLMETPSEKLKIEKIKRSSTSSNPQAVIDYYRKIDQGVDVSDESDFDERLSLSDKLAIRKASMGGKETVSPEDAARRMFSDAVPEALIKDPAIGIKLAMAKNEFESELSTMKKEDKTYEKLRDNALKKIANVSNDYGKALLERAGVDTGETKAQKIQRRKDRMMKIIQNYGDIEKASQDERVKALKREIEILEAMNE